MKLTLKRKFLGANYTIGDLFIDDKFFCNTIYLSKYAQRHFLYMLGQSLCRNCYSVWYIQGYYEIQSQIQTSIALPA